MSAGELMHYDPREYDGVTFIDESGSGVDAGSVRDALIGQHPEVAALVRWTVQTNGDAGRSRDQGIFARDRYVTPQSTFWQFRTAQDAAANDDVVSGVLESTEAMAFAHMSMLSEDQDEEDVWNQILEDVDLESRVREMWRELFTTSQFYAVTWWGKKDYKVRGRNSDTGTRRKKTYGQLTVPLGITVLDPTKVVPVGSLMFNQEQLAYIADRTEVDMLDAAVLNDPQADPISRQIIVAKYAPPDYERRNLAKEGINADWLYIMNPRNVWRHTLTRPQYRRFAEVRMTAIFELLDLKNQLKQMDRAHLIGGTNFIVLIKKGTEHHPAKPEEVANLQAQVKTVARVPILVGDHRLSVEIVTPKNDLTLSGDKYGTIDSRILSRLYQMFLIHSGVGVPRSDDSVKLAKVIARGLEARRFMMRRSLDQHVFRPCFNANDQLQAEAELRFHPTRIDLDFDPALLNFFLDIRDRGDLSRETLLEQVDLDQQQEFIRRQRESKDYDDTFTPTNVPWSTAGEPPGGGGEPKGPPNSGAPGADRTPGNTVTPTPTPGRSRGGGQGNRVAQDPKSAGRRQGGNRNGGGAAPGTGQGQAPRTGRPKNT